MNKSRLCSSMITICFTLITLSGAYGDDKKSYSADIEEGRIVSTQCAVCHGQNGEGNGAPKSKISGMDVNTFIKHIHDFKSGARKNVMMKRFVGMLSEKDIVNVAAYYASKE